jgi:hypothetical protein
MNMPLLEFQLSHFIMGLSIAVPRPIVVKTATD